MSVDIAKYNEIVAKANNCVNWFEKLDIKNNKINFYLNPPDFCFIRGVFRLRRKYV